MSEDGQLLSANTLFQISEPANTVMMNSSTDAPTVRRAAHSSSDSSPSR